MAVEFRTATVDDWLPVATLLSRAGLPLAGARDQLDRFVLGCQGPRIVATAAVERYGTAGLLRSVAIDETDRGGGLGEEVVRRVLDCAHDEGLHTVALLTTTAAGFFSRFGFVRVAREAVPAAVQASVEFTSACPASAVTLQLDTSLPPVLVRRARQNDAAALARLDNEDRATLETVLRTADEKRVWLAARGERHPVLVAERRGEVEGWAALSAFSTREAYRFVADLAIHVARESRRQGIGSRLMAAALERARALGYQKAVLTTLPALMGAQGLCARFGFRHVGDHREHGQIEGRRIDTRLMERLLD